MKTNHFKILLNVFSTEFTYSDCIVYRLLYFWKNKSPNICGEISKIGGMNLWQVYICNIKSSGKYNTETWEEGELIVKNYNLY